ncbi:MAG: hypothetical protein IH595_12980, partial [Bacteroidales bacterium]|nr:hypothetical protein [Bacteroidales bacterium]
AKYSLNQELTEPELLKNLTKLESDSQLLEIKIKIWKDEKGKNDLIKRNEAIKAEIEKLKGNLASLRNNKDGEEAKYSLNQELTEPELLKNLTKLESDSQLLEKKIKIRKDEKGKSDLIKRNEAIKAEIEKLKGNLEPINNKKYGEEAKSSIIRQATELELLRNLSKLESDSQVLEIKIKIRKDEKGKSDLIKQNDVIKAEIEKLKENLELINDKKYSEEAKCSIIRQLKEYISEISKAGQGRIENNLFEKIYSGLYTFIADRMSRDRTSALSYYDATRNDSTVDIDILLGFLNNEVQIVSNIDEPDYLNLRQYFMGLKDRIIKRFIG